mmetsp:Transcript_68569/g.108895  ORF Transcript_68569/g.108895 Transcript_68569/m.108895 type:complete len:213 (+) Transcript_68569:447-1085(+)
MSMDISAKLAFPEIAHPLLLQTHVLVANGIELLRHFGAREERIVLIVLCVLVLHHIEHGLIVGVDVDMLLHHRHRDGCCIAVIFIVVIVTVHDIIKQIAIVESEYFAPALAAQIHFLFLDVQRLIGGEQHIQLRLQALHFFPCVSGWNRVIDILRRNVSNLNHVRRTRSLHQRLFDFFAVPLALFLQHTRNIGRLDTRQTVSRCHSIHGHLA